MTLVRKMENAYYGLLASATMFVLDMSPAAAQSQNIGGVADTVKQQVGNVGKLVVTGSALGGVVMVGTGLMKLKQAADTQGQQVKYSEGMWRLGVGAGLVAISSTIGTLTQTFNFKGANINVGDGF